MLTKIVALTPPDLEGASDKLFDKIRPADGKAIARRQVSLRDRFTTWVIRVFSWLAK
jgi:hypothetical protein